MLRPQDRSLGVCGRVDHAQGWSRCCHGDGACLCSGGPQWKHLSEYGGGLRAPDEQVRYKAGALLKRTGCDFIQIELVCLCVFAPDGSWWALCLTVGPGPESPSVPLTSVRFETSARAPVTSLTVCSHIIIV